MPRRAFFPRDLDEKEWVWSGCRVVAPCSGVVRGVEQLHLCFVLQLCPVVDIVINLVNIQLMGTLNGTFPLEHQGLLPRVPCSPAVGNALSHV